MFAGCWEWARESLLRGEGKTDAVVTGRFKHPRLNFAGSRRQRHRRFELLHYCRPTSCSHHLRRHLTRCIFYFEEMRYGASGGVSIDYVNF